MTIIFNLPALLCWKRLSVGLYKRTTDQTRHIQEEAQTINAL